MDDIAFGRWGVGFAGSSGSMVALRLRFLSEGALDWVFGIRDDEFDVADVLP